MKTRPKPPAAADAPAPTVPTLDPESDPGRLAVAYGKSIDRAVVAEAKFDRYVRKGDEAKTDAYENGPWKKAMDAFDRTEEALFRAMKAAGLRAVIAEGRLYVDIQTHEDYLPDRPQRITWWTIGRPRS